MKDRYDEFGCDFKNEAFCEEELEEEGLDLYEVEQRHFQEDEV